MGHLLSLVRIHILQSTHVKDWPIVESFQSIRHIGSVTIGTEILRENIFTSNLCLITGECENVSSLEPISICLLISTILEFKLAVYSFNCASQTWSPTRWAVEECSCRGVPWAVEYETSHYLSHFSQNESLVLNAQFSQDTECSANAQSRRLTGANRSGIALATIFLFRLLFLSFSRSLVLLSRSLALLQLYLSLALHSCK